MWVLKLRAVSSYIPCLGSGALGGSSSLSGSCKTFSNKKHEHQSCTGLRMWGYDWTNTKPLTEGSSWSVFSIQVSRDCRSLGPWYFTASWSGLNNLSLHIRQYIQLHETRHGRFIISNLQLDERVKVNLSYNFNHKNRYSVNDYGVNCCICSYGMHGATSKFQPLR